MDRLIEASKLPAASSLVIRERELTRWMPDDDMPAMSMMLDEPLEARWACAAHARAVVWAWVICRLSGASAGDRWRPLLLQRAAPRARAFC